MYSEGLRQYSTSGLACRPVGRTRPIINRSADALTRRGYVVNDCIERFCIGPEQRVKKQREKYKMRRSKKIHNLDSEASNKGIEYHPSRWRCYSQGSE